MMSKGTSNQQHYQNDYDDAEYVVTVITSTAAIEATTEQEDQNDD